LSDVLKIYAVPERQLPSALTASTVFRDLSADQVKGLRSRLRYIEQLTAKLDEGAPRNRDDALEYLDDLELDVVIAQAGPMKDVEQTVSAWLIHTSWTVGTSPSQLLSHLPRTVVALLDRDSPGSRCSLEQLETWLHDCSEGLKHALASFYSAQDFPGAIAPLLAVDVVLALLHVALLRSRLNTMLISEN